MQWNHYSITTNGPPAYILHSILSLSCVRQGNYWNNKRKRVHGWGWKGVCLGGHFPVIYTLACMKYKVNLSLFCEPQTYWFHVKGPSQSGTQLWTKKVIQYFMYSFILFITNKTLKSGSAPLWNCLLQLRYVSTSFDHSRDWDFCLFFFKKRFS